MQYMPSEMERRYRLYITGRGDSGVSLFRFLREKGGVSGAWAAHVLSRIFLVKGRMDLALSYHDLSVELFRKEPGGDVPLELGINQALILWSRGDAAGAERVLRKILQQSIEENQIFLAAEAASNLSMILARTGRPEDAIPLNGLAETCYRVNEDEEGMVRVELNKSLIDYASDRHGVAVDRIAGVLARSRNKLLARERAEAATLLTEIFLADDDLEHVGEALRLAYSFRHTIRRFRPIRLRLLSLTSVFRSRCGEEERARRLEQKAERKRIMLGLHGMEYRPLAGLPLIYTVSGSARISRETLVSASRDTTTVQSIQCGNVRFITVDPRMRSLLNEIRRSAPLSVPVLIRGETGAGKELAGRLIHEWSGRGKAPFVPVNAAALTNELFESTLFGHVRGAFTGAVAERQGLLAAAGTGTLFLDEIAELGTTLQVKLLRFLDSGEFLPVGSDRERFSRARIVAATNRDLDRLMKAGSFRSDLFYRLNVLTFLLPPLRTRRGDITMLVDHFLSSVSVRPDLGPFTISDEARALLLSYDWPGNVRELRAEILRAAVRARKGVIRVCHLSTRLLRYLPVEEERLRNGLDRTILAFERGEIERALSAAGGNHSEAARILGLKRTTLLYRMKRHGIEGGPSPSHID